MILLSSSPTKCRKPLANKTQLQIEYKPKQ